MTNRITTGLFLGVLVLVFGGLAWIIVHQSNPTQMTTVSIVAGENFWGDIARQIGGPSVQVTSIINDPSVDPHLYESSAANAAAVAQADIVIENGAGYDDFLEKLASIPGKPDRTLILVATVLNANYSGANPHLWYDLPRISAVARAIEQALILKDPVNQATYAANLATFNASMEPLLADIQTIKTHYPGAPVGYTERVPGYLLEAAGLSVVSPVGFATAVEEGNDPSPADVAAFTTVITNHQIKLLLYNSQATSAVTQSIRDQAVAAGIPVIGVTETIPQVGQPFQEWQLSQLKAMLNGLRE